MNGKKVLVVDDEKALSSALALKLTREGFEVKVASNGEEALAWCEKENFEVILLDMLMPKVDGWGVLEKLKGKKIKIIVTSNLSQPDDITKAQKLGAVGFLVKSEVSLAEIVTKVRELAV
jgi:DNA-binding response OmpR family regulator